MNKAGMAPTIALAVTTIFSAAGCAVAPISSVVAPVATKKATEAAVNSEAGQKVIEGAGNLKDAAVDKACVSKTPGVVRAAKAAGLCPN